MKIYIGKEELNFKMTNQTIFDIDEKFGNYGEVLNGLMQGEHLYNNALKIVACSCTDRELSCAELIESLTPDQLHNDLVNFAITLYFAYRGINVNAEAKEETKAQSKKK